VGSELDRACTHRAAAPLYKLGGAGDAAGLGARPVRRAGEPCLVRSLPPLRPAFADMEVGTHRVTLLRDGEHAYPAMLDAIARAKRYVCLETYILRSDKTGERFANVLVERAHAGVEVSVLYDAWGSSLSVAYVERMREAGVRMTAFHPLHFSGPRREAFAKMTRRDHKKTLVVDGEVGFTGGLNISDDYAPKELGGRGWRDTHVRLEGPAALELEYFFMRTWRRGKGEPFDEPRYGSHGRRPDPQVHIVSNDLRHGRTAIRDMYRSAITGAKERIFITNAYFLPTIRLLMNLVRAARSGVDVRIIVAGTTDITAVLLASRALYRRLLNAGARIFEWKGRVLHAKTAVIDRRWCTVGSSNLDYQSLRHNLEVNAIIEDERFASALEDMFEDDLAHCEEIQKDAWEAARRPWDRAASWGMFLLRDWL
jgi:cardiolipin synthase